MVFCTYCGQSFTRDEHLERHILTHTNVKPFKCFTCHMSFARRDLLQRHYTVHGKDANNQDIVPAANGMIPRSAGRTPIACSNCAKTKTKCDKKFPCSRCSARNLKCTLRPTRRATKTAARTGVVQGQAESGTSETDAPAAQEPSEDENSKGSPGSPEQQSLPRPIAPASPKSLSPDDASRPQTTTGSPSIAQQNVPAHDVSPPIVSNILPPSTAAGVPFVPSSTIAGLEDLPQLSPGHPADPNSRFMLNWAQMQTPIPYENMMQPQMMVSPEMAFDMHAFPMPPHHEGMMTIMPDMSHGLASSLITPIETPKMLQRHMSEIALASSVGSHSIPSSQHPSYHQSYHMHPYMGPPPPPEYPQAEDEGEMAAIIAAQDAWSVFRCGPTIPSASCPKTALPNLERLRRTLGNFSEWNVWSPSFDEADMLDNEALTVMQVHESSRDKLFAISQSFLQKAFDIHGRGPTYAADSAATFPPAHVLSYFIRAYANCFERYFPLTPKGTVCVNELLHCHNNSLAASLLVLMMIAQGAVDIPSAGARMLTGGLTEVCRISLFDLIEKNINLASDHTVLHAALLFTVQAAWSGDKWQMDIAMGQRGMYFAMLRHSGALGYANQGAATGSQPSNTDKLWCDWIDNEKRSRLVYSWVMVDQDMALFHDCAPLFSVSEFAAPMPDADRLWHAKSAVEWSSIFEQVHEFGGNVSSLGSGARPLSLSQLFRHFLNDELIPRGIEMTPLQLRLLLHPLQSLLSQFNQLLSCFSDPTSDRNENIPRKVSASSTRNRVEEVQSLLGKWYDLAERYLKANPMCPMMQTNLVIFHLVSLNAVTDFPEIERLSRGEIMTIDFQSLLKTHKRCIFDVEEAVYHCGQVFRLVRSMPRNTRPPWWAGAIYRVALVLWTDSQMVKEDPPANNGMYPVSGPTFPIDRLMPEHPLIIRYLTKGEGSPCVTKRDGTQLSIDRPLPLMRHCVEVIDEGASTRFSDGIRSKLEGLCTRA